MSEKLKEALAQPAQEPVDWEQIYWDMVNAMLRDKLRTQPAREPVAWMHVQGDYEEPSWRQLDDDEIEMGWKQYPLYTTPPLRPWVGLTDKELNECVETPYVSRQWANIEAKLKEKNNGA